MKMRKIFLLMICVTLSQMVYGQRLVRRNSRHYIELQTLPARVNPLLTDTWDQYAPFNNLCPIDSITKERSVVGCVATSMSQVMHFWQWPKTYDWDNILDKYVEGEYTQQQADAVAQLSLDCGEAVKMRYSSVESGARSIYQPIALVNNYDYDCGVQMYYRDFYSLAEITIMLKKELAAHRPILISGYNRDGGHAYVIDGYNENDYFHVCWGNPGGIDNNWTTLTSMVPNQPEWYDIDSPECGFNLLQMFTLGIMPSNDANATGVKRHLFTFQSIKAVKENKDDPATYDRNNVRLTVHDLSNIGWDALDDSVCLMIKKDDEIVRPLYTYTHDFLLEEIEDTTYTDTLSLSFPHDLENGTYTIVPMYRDNSLNGGKEWVEARVCTGTPNYLIAHIEDNNVTLRSDTASTSYLTLESINFPDVMINAKAPEYDVTLRNHGGEMAGRIYFFMESLDGGKNFYLQRQGMTIDKDATYYIHHKKRAFSAPQLGLYKLHVCYESNLFADELIELPLPEEIIILVTTSDRIEIAEN